MADVYDDNERGDSPLGFGEPPKPGAPDFAPPKRYPSDRDTSRKELGGEGESQTNSATEAEQTALNSQAPTDQVGEGFTDTDKKKAGVVGRIKARFGIGSGGSQKGKMLAGGIIAFIILIVVAATFTVNIPTASIRAAGTGLVTGYLGSQIVAGKVHLGNYWDGAVMKGIRQECVGTKCTLVAEKPRTALGKWRIRAVTKMFEKLNAQGVQEILSDGAGNYKGLRISLAENDTLQAATSTKELESLIAKEYGVNKPVITVVEEPMILEDGQHYGGVYDIVETTGLTGKGALLNGVIKDTGAISGVSSKATYMRVGKGLGFGFHPLRDLRTKLSDWEGAQTEKMLTWLDESYAKITTGTTTDIAVTGTQKSGNTTENLDSASLNKSKLVESFRSIRTGTNDFLQTPGGKITGGGLMVLGGVCMASAFATAQNNMVVSNFVIPNEAMATLLISMADQVSATKQSDIDDASVGAAMMVLSQRDDKTGKTVDFSNSKTWQSINGQSGGTPLSTEYALMAGRTDDPAAAKAANAFTTFLSNPVVTELCSGVTGGVLMAGGIALSIASGGALVAAIGVVGGAAIGLGVEALGSLSAASPPDYKNLSADQRYNLAGEGAFNLDRTKAWISGGDPQTAADHDTMSKAYVAGIESEFASQNIAYRLFNMNDPQSVASKVALNGSSTMSGTLSNMASALTNIGTNITSTFGSLLSGRASASATIFSPCPLNKQGCIGQSAAVLKDDGSAGEDLVSRTDAEATKYKGLMKECRDVEYIQGSDGLWTTSVVSGMPAYTKFLTGRLPAECNNLTNDKNWIALQSYNHLEPQVAYQVCYDADNATADDTDKSACAAVGYGSSGATSLNTPTTPVTGAFDVKAWTTSHPNGELDTKNSSELKKVSHQCNQTPMTLPYLQPNAADALESFNTAFKQKYGQDMYFESCYRDIAGQKYAKNKYGSGAADVKTSNHGWGLAADLGPNSKKFRGCDFTVSATKPNLTASEKGMCNWMLDNASTYGFKAWTVPSEMWHFKYVGT